MEIERSIGSALSSTTTDGDLCTDPSVILVRLPLRSQVFVYDGQNGDDERNGDKLYILRTIKVLPLHGKSFSQ